jgi:flavin reductase (DIM6/NTAB) family NADH-FMN oxidoreductase RutF
MTIDPKEVTPARMHALLLGSVIPRPIAFASTVDKAGNVNLSPFSFFNCFGSNPPILIFSPSRRGRDNTTKHTYENVLEVDEVVIHIVSYSMVHQMSLASVEFPRGVNEFMKAGFTAGASSLVKPPRVMEAAVAFECKVVNVIPMGDQGGAGNLVLCRVLLMHVKDEVLDDSGRVDPFKLDAVARLGGDWYSRVHGSSIFKVPKPLDKLGIGIDKLPAHIRNSKVLTGNDLGLLAAIEELPRQPRVMSDDEKIALTNVGTLSVEALHVLAHHYLEQGLVEQAWNVLLSVNADS